MTFNNLTICDIYLMYICPIGFVHHSDQTIHFGLKIVQLLPSWLSWVIKQPNERNIDQPLIRILFKTPDQS